MSSLGCRRSVMQMPTPNTSPPGHNRTLTVITSVTTASETTARHRSPQRRAHRQRPPRHRPARHQPLELRHLLQDRSKTMPELDHPERKTRRPRLRGDGCMHGRPFKPKSGQRAVLPPVKKTNPSETPPTPLTTQAKLKMIFRAHGCRMGWLPTFTTDARQ